MVERLAVIVALLILATASYTDIKERRVPAYLWGVGFELALFFLAYQTWGAVVGPTTNEVFLIRAGISIGLLCSLGLIFSPAGLHLFGGADAKAFILLGLLLPTFPSIPVAGTQLPLVESQIGVLSMSVVVNGLVLTLCYPLFLFARNIVRNVNGSGQVPRQRAGVKLLFISKAVAVEDLVEEHGRLVSTKDGQRTDGLDLDALRMYMRWRDTDLEELRGNPNRYRVVVPRDTSEPTDGRVLDGGASYGADPWAAETFLREHEAYGTTPDQLRDGLDAIVAKDVVFVMPGIPLIVSLLLGLATAVTVGDFFALVSQLL